MLQNTIIVINLKKQLARTLIFPLALGMKLDKFILQSSKSNCLNIYFHGVSPNNFLEISGRHMLANQFEKLIKYLVKNYTIIPLSDAFKESNRQTYRKKQITISFDDGYLNNLTYAIPILKKYNVPTTFFVCGVSVTNKEYLMWTDLVALCRYWERSDALVLNSISFKKKHKYSIINEENGLDGYTYLKMESLEVRNKVFNELMINYNVRERIQEVDSSYWKLLDGDQILEISKDPLFEIASHGMMHHNLAYIDSDTAKFDIENSKKVIDSVNKKDTISFSFPDGNYNSEVKQYCKSAGFKHLLAVDYKLKEDINDLSILPRFGISSTTTFESNAIAISNAFKKYGI